MIISRAIKRVLGWAWILITMHPKAYTNNHIRAYWEWVIIQVTFINNDCEHVFIDEFSI